MDPKDLKKIQNAIDDPEKDFGVLFLSAETGIGKSTYIPKNLAEKGHRVFVLNPTVTACYSLAERVRNLNPKLSIGTGAEGNIQYDSKTKLVYMTTGHFVSLLSSCVRHGVPAEFPDIDILFVDEAHLGTIDVSQTLFYWIYFQKYVPEKFLDNLPLLVLASATLDIRQVSALSAVENIEAFVFGKRKYPIEIRYHDKDFSPDSKNISEEILNVLTEIFSQEEPKGHVLIFVSGSKEAERLQKECFSLSWVKSRDDLVIYAAHSSLGQEVLQKILQPDEKGRKKIIFATNVFETSLTVDGVSLVLDSGFEKITENSDSGGTRLKTVFISQSSAKQRAGRTGRTLPGICYRMYTQNKFENTPSSREEEIFRIPIYKQILQVLESGIDPYDFFTGIPKQKILDSLEFLEQKKIVRQKSFLKISGKKVQEKIPLKERKKFAEENILFPADPEKNFYLLDQNKNSSLSEKFSSEEISRYVVQDVGKFVLRLPIGIRTGLILYQWIARHDMKGLFPAILLVSILDKADESFFYIPSQSIDIGMNKIFEIQKQIIKDYNGPEPLEMILNVFKEVLKFCQEQFEKSRRREKNFFEPDVRNLNKFCLERNLNARKIRETLSLVKRIHSTCEKILNREIKIGSSFKNKVLFEMIDPFLLTVYEEFLIHKKDEKYLSNSGREYELSSDSLYLNAELPKKFLALSTFEVQRGKKLKSFISLYRSLPENIEDEIEEDFDMRELLNQDFEFKEMDFEKNFE